MFLGVSLLAPSFPWRCFISNSPHKLTLLIFKLCRLFLYGFPFEACECCLFSLTAMNGGGIVVVQTLQQKMSRETRQH
jgi:hypothetical protein